MAGRPLGLRSLVKALGKLSPAQIRHILASAPRSGLLERLEAKRDRHLAAIKKLDRKIAKLSGGKGHVAAPTKKRRRRKMSAETRRKMSDAAKRRHAKARGSRMPAGLTPGKPAGARSLRRRARRWRKLPGGDGRR
jgi:hypothetical protein